MGSEWLLMEIIQIEMNTAKYAVGVPEVYPAL